MLLQYSCSGDSEICMFFLIYMLTFLGIYFAIGIICAYLVFKDARGRRNVNTFGWTTIVIFTNLLGLITYYAMKHR